MKVIPLVACICILVPGALTQHGWASMITINGQSYTTQFNTGSGADHALMVLEYGPSVNYAFGYSWNPASSTPSGYDMLSAVAANSGGDMTLNVSFFDFGSGPEPFVNTIDYLTHQPPANYPTSWFNYFTSDGGSDWTNASAGISASMLADGSADDWVFQNVPPDANFNPLVLPAFAIVAAPEPASLGVLGVGFVWFLRRRRISR